MRRDDVLEACRQIHDGESGDAIAVVLEHLQNFPVLVRKSLILPELLKAASKFVRDGPDFERNYPRPQIREALEAPLTFINGAQIGVWNFSESVNPFSFGSSELRSLVVTGTGPATVCSRIHAIVSDLASERNSDADLVVTGCSRFDLTDSGKGSSGAADWPAAQFCDAVVELARATQSEEVVNRVGRDYLLSLAPIVLRSTVGIARQGLEEIAQQKGFVESRDIECESLAITESSLSDRLEQSSSESMPVLAEYKHQGRPVEVELADEYLGLEQYKSVASAYPRAVQKQRIAEWERRRDLYESWCLTSIREWQRLSAMDARALEEERTFIHLSVDFETARTKRLDRPDCVSGTQRLQGLPRLIVDNLAWWAQAMYRIQVVSGQPDFQPWMDTYLVDAFLRGRRIPDEDESLQDSYQRWQRKWRPLALYALDRGVRKQGLTLLDITTEQTIFKVVAKRNNTLVLRLLHVWDPSFDPIPTIAATGATIYRPKYGARSMTFSPGSDAQVVATRRVTNALTASPVSGDDLAGALSFDSGEALDHLVEHLTQPLMKAGIEKDLAEIPAEAVRLDPFLRFSFSKRLSSLNTLGDYINFAKECGEQGAKKSALPDFLAWELFLVAETVRDRMSKLANETIPLLSNLRRLMGNHQSTQFEKRLGGLPTNLDIETTKQLSGLSAWEIVVAISQPGSAANTVDEVLKTLGDKYSVRSLCGILAVLRSSHPAYAQECLRTKVGAPRSEERQRQSVPACLTDWKRVCYHLAAGDIAAALAFLLVPGGENLGQDSLRKLSEQVADYEIPAAFESLDQRRRRLVYEIGRYIDAGDVVSLDYASRRIRKEFQELIDEAQSEYSSAAIRDRRYGTGWLRLAGLRWRITNYREALDALVGPAPQQNLQSARLPLALAIRLAGGSLDFSGMTSGRWTSATETALRVEGPDETGLITISALQQSVPGEVLGRCEISKMSVNDGRFLAGFLRKYEPGMLRSAGDNSCEEWLSLVQVPALGTRGSLAKALQENAQFAVLAAGVFLGMPAVLDAVKTGPRPDSWLENDVIVSMRW